MYDVIIVGAGAAGCVLAHRLSEDGQRKILLIEAGPDYPEPDSLPEEIAKSFSRSEITHDWGYTSEADDLGVSIALPRAKVIGGCTATNATVALRGLPADYAEWVELGNSEWSFDAVLPLFRKLETDHNFDNEWHGASGPIPIRREERADLTPLQTAFLEACEARAYPYVEDYNAPDQIGYSLVPKNMIAGMRQSTALTYLASARSRRNLTIRSDVLVDRILLEGGAAAGVLLAGKGEEIKAHNVVLSAGAYSSPLILMRSGIGPSDHLEDHGVPCHVGLTGVGANLSDHPLFCMEFATNWAPPQGRIQMVQTMLTCQSELRRYKQDIQIFPLSVTQPADPEATPGMGYARINSVLLKPHSRGQVRLRSENPMDPPRINLGYFSHPDDLPRMVEAARRVRELAQTPSLSEMLVEETYPGFQVTADADLGAAIRSRIRTIHHPVGTCRMGPASDVGAVVDGKGKVHGMDRLFVVDASIMPTVPSANTNVPTIMLAEGCAAWLQEYL